MTWAPACLPSSEAKKGDGDDGRHDDAVSAPGDLAEAWGAIGGVVAFNLGWLLAGALQGDGYSVASHDVSGLGALTARSPWVMLTAEVIG
jgi:hypothetical protein